MGAAKYTGVISLYFRVLVIISESISKAQFRLQYTIKLVVVKIQMSPSPKKTELIGKVTYQPFKFISMEFHLMKSTALVTTSRRGVEFSGLRRSDRAVKMEISAMSALTEFFCEKGSSV
jgi:hypothetical protein